MSRDSNLVQLTTEIDRQRGLIKEQIDDLDSEMLTKPEVIASSALAELAKIRRKFETQSTKVK